MDSNRAARSALDGERISYWEKRTITMVIDPIWNDTSSDLDIEPIGTDMKISPCPLCAHRSELKHPLGEGWWQVICQSCGCRTGETHKLSKEQVIERWNTRYSELIVEILAPRLGSRSQQLPEPRIAQRLADVVMMLDTPRTYNREYIAAVCRSILSSVSSTDSNTPETK